MNLRGIKEYLLVNPMADSIYEMKRLEWIFIGVRWLWVPTVFVLDWLHKPISHVAMWWIGAALVLVNIVACIANSRINSLRMQKGLGVILLIIDTVAAWGIILLFAYDFYTSAYAAFVYVIIEAAVRFSTSGYTFWISIILLVSVSVGIIANEWERQRRKSEKLMKDSIILSFAPQLLKPVQAYPEAGEIPDVKLMEPLTDRESEILGLIAAGKSNFEIAGTLDIKEKTVKNNINRIYSKLNIKSRYEAISYMLRRG